jgi:hypothetical protein
MALRLRRRVWCDGSMFIGAEVRLGLGFNAAQARLANLARGGLVRHASDDAYRDLGSGLARIGPLGAAPGMSKLVVVRFTDMAVRENPAAGAMRWEATGPGGALFPALDADITLTQVGHDATRGPGRLPAAARRPGRRTGPGGLAPGRPGDYPGFHASHPGRHHGPCHLRRGGRYRPGAGIPAVA